jgi:hypothetical protein
MIRVLLKVKLILIYTNQTMILLCTSQLMIRQLLHCMKYFFLNNFMSHYHHFLSSDVQYTFILRYIPFCIHGVGIM